MPYLDLEIFWDSKGTLQFKVHLKENQKIKYLNFGSSHTKCCMKAILLGVFNCLAKLTSPTSSNIDQQINQI